MACKICNQKVAGSIPAAGTSNRGHMAFPSRLSPALVALCLAFTPAASLLAQDDGLTFEQAQTRTAYAREQMQAAERKLRNLERKEKSAAHSLTAAEKRLEEARARAEEATQARIAAEAELSSLRDRWAQESARLQRIHRDNESRHRAQ
jgi:septal ring factor EnvC (AmiA/AmiB activator)